jgi:DNA-binding CsgD family transcriptional regulator
MILEREIELSELERLLHAAPTVGGRVVLIRGEAGIGKSMLVEQFRVIADRQAEVLIGACDDLLTPQPLGPIWDLARNDSNLVQPLIDGNRRAVMERLLGLLCRAQQPTVLVLEDTQWADEATLDLVKFLGRRIGRSNGLLVLTYRDVEVDLDHPLRKVIGELPPQSLVRITLRPLSANAVSSMMGSRSFDVHEVIALTGGNPLFVTEVLASGTGAVPLSVRDSVLARAAKVSPGARRLLEMVSVVPRDVEMALVEKIVGPTPAHVADCVRQGLLKVNGVRVSFLHELQRTSVESSLAPVERRRLNQLVVEGLGETGDPARLIHHATEAGDSLNIVKFAVLAAHAAMAIQSTQEAAKHFRLLGPYLDQIDVVQRGDVLAEWAIQEHRLEGANSVDVAEQAVQVLRTAGDPVRLARALVTASQASISHQLTDKGIAYSAESVALLEPLGPSRELAQALSHRASVEFLYVDADEYVLPLVSRAIVVAREVGDNEALSAALTLKGYLIFSRGDMGGVALVEESLYLAERSGDQWGEATALVDMAGMHADVRDIARASDFALRARETAARYELRQIEAASEAVYAEILLWKGDWNGAENAASDALGSTPRVDNIVARILTSIQVRRGRNEAHTAIQRLWTLMAGISAPSALDAAAATLAECMWLSDDRNPEMIARLQEILAKHIALGRPWPSGAFAFWMWKLGLLDATPAGTVDFYGSIINGEYRAAAEFWHDKGIPYEQGLALMHGTEHEQIDAIRIFEDLGAIAAANKVRQALAHHGVRVPRGGSLATRDHPAGLTARQAEVLEFVARGRTNAHIADELFVSHRTVENHVSSILMKLDVATRDDAVAAARRRGILPAEQTNQGA